MAAVILWAGNVVQTNHSNAQNILGKPNGEMAGMGKDSSIRVGDFRGGFYPDLSNLLGVPAKVLVKADVIAFEFNGGSPGPSGGWESSHWTFSDGKSELSVAFDESAKATRPAAVVANGSCSVARYSEFFGFTPTADLGTVVSYILFALPPKMNMGSPEFTIQLAGGGELPGEGTPDPDAIGIFPCARALRGVK